MDTVSLGKIGKYEIIKVLGRGGMGEVLLARDEDLDRKVAIKRPFRSAEDEGLARFQVEAKAATLKHPNIPAVYEMGEQDGLPYIAMEYVEGETLDRLITSGTDLDLIDKLSIIEQICLAIGYAHEKGIIHRDIKPANIIVQKDGVAKIIDFGIAKIQEAGVTKGLTQTRQVIGSLHYIAPERFKGVPIDGRADIFSTGVTLYKLLTGKEPFTGGETTAAYKIVNEAHNSLAAYLHDYPPALDEIINKSLAKNPSDRYATGEDFADALQEVIEDLKHNRVSQLFNDAERLTTEKRFTPALELLDEAIKLDPANTQVRKLRKFVREHQERLRRMERIRECSIRAEEALLSDDFEQALSLLKEAYNYDSTSEEITQKIQSVEEQKRRYEKSAHALADAEAARNRGDITGALRIVTKALEEDPGNKRLLPLNEILVKQAKIEAQRGKLLEILEKASDELAARKFSAVDTLLDQASSIDPSDLTVDKLRRELAKAREQEQRRSIIDDIQTQVTVLLRAENYEQATHLLTRNIEQFPNEMALQRLRAEVDSEASKSEASRFVEGVISQAKELFTRSPLEGLEVLQKALDQLPGNERLISYERSLRQQLDTLRVEQVHADTLHRARVMVTGKQFDKAVGILESFQLEYGHHADIDELLAFAQDKRANLQRKEIVDRCTTDGRALLRAGRLDEAIHLLEYGIDQTGESTLSRLLVEAREQQTTLTRKNDILMKRVELARERGELDEAIGLLQEQLAEIPGNAPAQELLTALLAERELKQATSNAIHAAQEAAQRQDFNAGLESLQAVQRAYGESAEINTAIQEIQSERAHCAQSMVGQSIESARAALLQLDPQGALEALKSATHLVEFADAKQQADWQRIAQSVKKALEQSGAAASGAALDAQLPDIAIARPRRMPIWAIAAAFVAVIAIAAFAVWKMQPASPVPVAHTAHIKIAKAPPGAAVSIDSGPSSPTDDNGNFTQEVQPGKHQIQVTKEGYESFTDNLAVNAGEWSTDNVTLAKIPSAGTAGRLSPQGNVSVFKLEVDGANLGLRRAGESIPLEQGTHKVRYTAQDNSDSVEHTIQIAANKNVADNFTLKPKPAPQPIPGATVGQLSIQTTPGAQIAINGHGIGSADASGKYLVQGLTPKQYAVYIQLDKYQPANIPVTIVAGQTQPIYAQLTPVPTTTPQPQVVLSPKGSLYANPNSIERGQSVTLNWSVENASSVSISEIGAVALQGRTIVTPNKSTTYELAANGSIRLAQQYVEVHEPKTVPQPQPVIPNPKPIVPTPIQPTQTLPDRAALVQALAPYKSVFAQASGGNCKAAFSSAYGGRLKDLAGWCGSAKSFEVNEQCNQVGGIPDAPTLSCNETRIIHPKDGDPQTSSSSKVFHFTKGSNGAWQISGW
jgi:serine/threonine-protein kinase